MLSGNDFHNTGSVTLWKTHFPKKLSSINLKGMAPSPVSDSSLSDSFTSGSIFTDIAGLQLRMLYHDIFIHISLAANICLAIRVKL